jgi:DNA-binding NarL/FixJ family response regulator
MKNTKIVIVGDQRLIRESCAYLLNQDNNIYALAMGGDSTDLSSIAFTPSIVIIAGTVNHMNGPDLVGFVKGIFPSAGILGLFMTTHLGYARNMLRAGMSGYLSEDSSIAEFFQAIEKLTSGTEYICDEVKTLLSSRALIENKKVDDIQSLSCRELQIIDLVIKGSTSKDIGSRLNIAYRTVETHRHNILRKLNIKKSTALVNFMHSAGALANAI